MRIVIDIDPVEEKALLTDMLDIKEWVTNAVTEKIRRVIDRRCQEALAEGSEGIEPLPAQHRAVIARDLSDQGVVAPDVKRMPVEIKRKIITLAVTTTAARRNHDLDRAP